MSEEELALFRAWAAAGAPEGNPGDLPPLPKFANGWRLGQPDLIVKMTEPFSVRADGADILQNFVIPIPTREDRLVAAIEFHPGNASVVHHAVLFLDDKGHGRKLDAATPEPGYANFGRGDARRDALLLLPHHRAEIRGRGPHHFSLDGPRPKTAARKSRAGLGALPRKVGDF